MNASSRRLSAFWPAGPLAAMVVAALGVGFVAQRPKPPAEAVVAAVAPAIDAAPTGAISASPFGALHPAIAPPLAPEIARLDAGELAGFSDAAGFYRKNQFPQGDGAASAITDAVARAALDWIALRVAATPDRLAAFETAHPDWPMRDWMRSVREGWLFAGKPSPAETLATLGETPPLTSAGKIALARAQLALGKRDEAQAVIRALWRDGDIDAATETVLLREFAAMLTREDHSARTSRLLYAERGGPAWRAATLGGADIQALTRARWEAAKGPLTARTSSAVPPAARSDPGFLFAHVQDSRRAGRLDEAASWLALAPRDADRLVDPDKWWSERRMVARLFLDRGEFEKAYKVSDAAIARASPAKVDAAFFAGWIALRFLNDPARAAPHFAAAVQAAETPISIARANYWRGRTAEALGQSDDAHGFYSKAAAYPIAYYGQLAAQKLGATEISLRRPAAAATGEERAEATRVIELYLAAGLDDFVGPVAYAAAKSWDEEAQLAALALVLRARAAASINVVFGKIAIERGFPLDAVAFPTFGLPDFEPLSGSAALGQVMAVARQESEFIPRAASGAGAKGLMQILPGTAADTARKAGVPYDYNRLISDPGYNMQLGAAFLGQLVTAEGGSLPMAAAAYNAGGGRVAQWVNAFGDPRNGADIVDWVERIPYDETRDYVMRVMENYSVYQARLAQAPEPRASGALAKR